MLLEYRDYSIAMRPKDTTSATGTLYRDISAEYKEMVDYYIDASSSIVYSNVYTNIDLIYYVNDNGVKELIVIKAPTERSEFEFELMLGNVTGVMEGDNICFNDSGGKTVFTIDELFAVDAAGGYTDDVSAALVTNQGLSSIKLRVSEDYLNDPQREYPIIIDPSVMVTGATKTADAFVREGTPDTNYKMSEELRIGNSQGCGLERTYIKFTLPTNISASKVTNVVMRLKLRGGQGMAMRAHRVLSSWSSGSITWNNKPSYVLSGSNLPNSGNAPWYELDVTTETKQHLAGTYANYGFVVISQRENASVSATSFYSSDAPSPNKPELVITYQTSGVYYGCRPYESSTGDSQNCMGYALDKMVYVDARALGYTNSSSMWNYSIDQMTSVYVSKIQAWMNNNMGTRDYRSIASYNTSIALTEYRVATKVAFYDHDGDNKFTRTTLNIYDMFNPEDDNLMYHWWYQTETGTWAQKDGSGDSSEIGVTNSNTDWYNSSMIVEGNTKYYAVEADILF